MSERERERDIERALARASEREIRREHRSAARSSTSEHSRAVCRRGTRARRGTRRERWVGLPTDLPSDEKAEAAALARRPCARAARARAGLGVARRRVARDRAEHLGAWRRHINIPPFLYNWTPAARCVTVALQTWAGAFKKVPRHVESTSAYVAGVPGTVPSRRAAASPARVARRCGVSLSALWQREAGGGVKR